MGKSCSFGCFFCVCVTKQNAKQQNAKMPKSVKQKQKPITTSRRTRMPSGSEHPSGPSVRWRMSGCDLSSSLWLDGRLTSKVIPAPHHQVKSTSQVNAGVICLFSAGTNRIESNASAPTKRVLNVRCHMLNQNAHCKCK